MYRRHESDFDRSFRRMRRFVSVFIAFVFVLLIVFFGLMGYGVYKAAGLASDPAAVGNYAGSIVRGYNDTVNK